MQFVVPLEKPCPGASSPTPFLSAWAIHRGSTNTEPGAGATGSNTRSLSFLLSTIETAIHPRPHSFAARFVSDPLLSRILCPLPSSPQICIGDPDHEPKTAPDPAANHRLFPAGSWCSGIPSLSRSKTSAPILHRGARKFTILNCRPLGAGSRKSQRRSR